MSYLMHYGILRRSGRYPWGSGEHPYQSERDFLGRVNQLKKEGLTEAEIARGMGFENTSELRAYSRIARESQAEIDRDKALKLKDKGYSNVAIAKELGVTEGTVRNMLKPVMDQRRDKVAVTAEMLASSVKEKGLIDVGVGTEISMGISRTQLKTALAMLKAEGYNVYYSKVTQQGTGKDTSLMVLASPDTTYPQFYANRDKIKLANGHSEDGGTSFYKTEPPRSVSSSRISIRYAEDGGIEKDGVIELRRGVEDISLGNARYAQVRIAVDDTHYLKGMAMYSDDMPKGVDIIFNTNKKKGTPMIGDDPNNEVLKRLKPDKDNPFGATILGDEDLSLIQRHYVDSNGKTQLSALNIVNEEGKWGEWRKTLSSQFLSKQSPALAKKQLALAYDSKKDEYDEIMALTNPTVKKRLLDSFADDCDASAVHLKAAAMPRQTSSVILPFPDMKDTEIYAPNYNNGEQVVLIRYPHAGKFEIPQLTVNNKHPNAKKALGDSRDVVGISSAVAAKLSGADFDGDTVLVIPNNKGEIQTQPSLAALEKFDPKEQYKLPSSAPKMDSTTKGIEMGKVSNLITDMTIKGANVDEIVRAVKHSMVVIDAEKHHLDYKKSARDNNIAELKKKYQGSEKSGASTLISRSSAKAYIPKRKEGVKVLDPETGKEKTIYVDPETGKKLYTPTGETKKKAVRDESGKIIGYEDTGELRKTETTRMSIVDDAFELSSGTRIETIYANHANQLKALANQARKNSLSIVSIPYDPSAKKAYATEVSSLEAKLRLAKSNAPLERQAQILAESMVRAKREANPDMDADDVKKAKGQSLTLARLRTGASKQRIDITDKEWEAIQAGAITQTKLSEILNNTDLDKVKQLATPRTATLMSDAKLARAKTMLNNGHTQAEVASMLGVSVSTLQKSLYK